MINKDLVINAGNISMAIDGILGIVNKGTKLLVSVQVIADGLRKLLNL